jgi:hypothetical protein
VKEIQNSGILPLFAVIQIGSTPTPASIRPDLYFIQREKRLRQEREVDIVAVLADRGRALSSGANSNDSKKGFIFFPQTCWEVDIVS